MNSPYKVSESNATVTVAAILSGDAPAIRVIYRTVGANKVVRPILRQIPVSDAGLFARVQAELHEGDSIEIVAVNEWYEDGYATRLKGFRKATDLNAEGRVKNGMINIVQNDITHFTVPPARDTKTKVEH